MFVPLAFLASRYGQVGAYTGNQGEILALLPMPGPCGLLRGERFPVFVSPKGIQSLEALNSVWKVDDTNVA